MPVFVKARRFLRNLFSSRRVELDLDQEVHAHLEMLTDENIRAGMPPEEAQRAARIELGGIEQVKEQVREERIGNWLHSVIFDCRYGVRQLRKNPGFDLRGGSAGNCGGDAWTGSWARCGKTFGSPFAVSIKTAAFLCWPCSRSRWASARPR